MLIDIRTVHVGVDKLLNANDVLLSYCLLVLSHGLLLNLHKILSDLDDEVALVVAALLEHLVLSRPLVQPAPHPRPLVVHVVR